jgi:3-methylcrotonyl-CoA carboxylase alpha subunit
MVKASAGGGGKGMRRVEMPSGFHAALEGAKREARSAFGDDRVLIEKYLPKPRHIEVQIFSDSHGSTVHLFERDCSLQRRHQKVIEETPAPGMTESMRRAMGAVAVKAADAVGYRGAGTVEFIADVSEGLREDRFFFMEMNTRLQVEHPVTEMITGQDLVEWQFRVACGETLPLKQEQLSINGHAMEARLYSEDPSRDFLPQTGTLTRLRFGGARIDAGVREGDAIAPYYDPMIATIIVHAPSRAAALDRLSAALAGTQVAGCRTNCVFLHRLSRLPGFMSGDVDTGLIARNMDVLTGAGAAPPEAVIAASLHAAGYMGSIAGPSPFERLKGFRIWGPSVTHIRLGSQDVALSNFGNGRFEAEWTGERHPFGHAGFAGDQLRLDLGGRIVPLAAYGDGTSVTVHAPDGIFEFSRPSAERTDGELKGSGDTVRSAMPGLVRLVSVKPGQSVVKGEALVVTEAMKMENTIHAPRDGIVELVHVEAGQQIKEGALLVSIAPLAKSPSA